MTLGQKIFLGLLVFAFVWIFFRILSFLAILVSYLT